MLHSNAFHTNTVSLKIVWYNNITATDHCIVTIKVQKIYLLKLSSTISIMSLRFDKNVSQVADSNVAASFIS